MIFCSSHFLPFLLLSHFPLLGVATCSCPPTLVYGDSGVRAATLSFPPAEQQTQQEHPHPHLVRSGLGFGRGQTLGRGLGRRGSSSFSWLSSGCSPPPRPHLPAGKPQHYHSIIVTATNPLPTTLPPLVTPTSGSEPCSDQITMMSIWGWVGKGEWEGTEPTFLYFVLYVFFNM